MEELERALNDELEKDLPNAKLKHEFPKLAVQRDPHQQLENFMESGKRMLDIQQKRLIDVESAYQLDRIKLLDRYRVRLETLKNECAEAVRELDLDHQQKMADGQKLLMRLNAMRALD